ncbi:isopeptide-forming domain-containing fimbrial protein [Pseudoscardovia suis]
MKTATHTHKATARTVVATLVAVLAAMATLLAVACMPDGSLPQARAATGTSSITVVNAQAGRTYDAYRFATFSDVNAATGSTGSDSTVASLDVTTVPCTETNGEKCWGYQLKRAYATAKGSNSSLPDWDVAYEDNPAAFMTQLKGDELATMMNYFALPLGLTPDGSATNNTKEAQDITISNIPEGWYVVVDTTDGARKAVVATTITANGTTYTKFTLDEGTGQSTINDALGRFYAKDVDLQTTPSKHIYIDAEHNNPQAFGNFSIGDKLYYKVDTKISAHAANYNDYTFVIRDQATRGLTIDESTVVLGEADSQSGTMSTVPADDYTVKLTTAADKTTTLDVSIKSPKAHAGKYLQLTYTATLNSDAVTAGTYTTAKSGDTEETTTKDVDANTVENQARVNANRQGWTAFASVTSYTGSVSFTKVGVGDQAAGLGGVTFQVFKGDSAVQGDDNKPLTFTKVDDGVYNYDPASTNADVVSAVNGTVRLNGLGAGIISGKSQQYTLKETATNTSLGYAQSILATFTVDHAISQTGVVKDSLSGDANNRLGLAYEEQNAIKVKNVKNFTQLPLTGAAGVALFALLALVLGSAAAVLTIKYRNTRKQLDGSLAE